MQSKLMYPILALALASGCTERQDSASAANEASRLSPLPVTLIDAKGENVGTAVVTQTPQGIEIALDVHDLPPGEHAAHIHENAKCEAPNFESAGGHFNPLHKSHGIQNPDGPHAGDLRDIVVRSDGSVQTIISAPRLTLEAGEMSLLRGGGTSLVIHATADDDKTDPSGNSGTRIACGVMHR
jgi:superoxide dismutase, Cu-Zn family